MKEISVVVYTMKGCPFCVEFKDMLKENNIEFHDRDIHEYKEEYELYCKVTECDLIPALMVIESYGETHKSFLYAPEKDYNELDEAVKIIQEHRNNSHLV